MLDVVLYQPEIPPNTGNIIRLCANTGAQLHLIHPLGFELDDAKLRRAGLDYRELAVVHEHTTIGGFIQAAQPSRIMAFSTRGRHPYAEAHFAAGDALLFGPETRGLPQAMLDELGEENVWRIPMLAGSRSLNLSNAVAVVVYEAWRQLGFTGAV